MQYYTVASKQVLGQTSEGWKVSSPRMVVVALPIPHILLWLPSPSSSADPQTALNVTDAMLCHSLPLGTQSTTEEAQAPLLERETHIAGGNVERANVCKEAIWMPAPVEPSNDSSSSHHRGQPHQRHT